MSTVCAVGLAQEPEVPGPEAQEPEVKNEDKSDMDSGRINEVDPLTGLIINRTITVLGWDFYKGFSDIWQSMYPDSESNLTIVERPTAQFGSEIWVNYLDRPVFHTFLSPARSEVREVTKEAVAAAHDNIAQIDIEREFSHNDDLGPEEL